MNSRSPRHTPARAGAAVHRPASVLPPVAVAAPLNFAPNAALLIDFDNVTMGIRSDLQTELKNLLASDIIKGKVQLRRAYADWRRYPQYVAPLAESSIDMIMAPAYGSSKKNATDIRLAIDALELVFTRPEIGTYILLSGDSDFSTLVIKLKEYGKYVIGVGIRESSSDLLVMNCDEYYSYNTLAGLVRAGEEEASGGVRRDPWELVSEAIARMQRNDDVMRADRLKQVMQDIDSTFDEKNLGMSKFSRFVQEAAQRGLLSLTKLDNGQLEVGPAQPREAGANGALERAPAPIPTLTAGEERSDEHAERPSADRAPGERGEERGRRSRRGGRGRGRVREGRGARESGPAGANAVEPGTPAASVASAGLTPTSTSSAGSASTGLTLEPPPAVSHVAAPGTEKHAAPARDDIRDTGRESRDEKRDATHEPARLSAVGSGESEIGTAGERLTRDEAFDLVRRAVSALEAKDEAARASDVRIKAFELLGRDSESLSERNFSRILRDAHDADVIDLRRRGDDYEVARAVSAAPVAQQINVAVAARAGGEAGGTPSAPSSPAMPRGLGMRGAGSRRRGGSSARSSTPPADLLTIGIVDIGPRLPAASERAPMAGAEDPAVQAIEPVTRAAAFVPSGSVEAMVAGPAASVSPSKEHRAPRASGRTTVAKRGSVRTKRASSDVPAANADAKPKAKRPRSRAAAKSTEG